MDLVSTITEDELSFIAGLDYGQDKDGHLCALRELIFSQNSVLGEDQTWFPYEVIELGANQLQPGHEREFAICTLLVINAVRSGRDKSTDLQDKFMQHATAYQALPEQLSALVLQAYSGAGC